MAEYAKRDKKIEELQCELDHRKSLLTKKVANLKETVKTNGLLKGVLKDYRHYNESVIQEKKRQQDAMKTILEHLNMVLKEEKLTKESLEHAKIQQHEILGEMEKVKKSLDEIVSVDKL